MIKVEPPFNSYEITYMILIVRPKFKFLLDGLDKGWWRVIPQERRRYLKNYINENYSHKWLKEHI